MLTRWKHCNTEISIYSDNSEFLVTRKLSSFALREVNKINKNKHRVMIRENFEWFIYTIINTGVSGGNAQTTAAGDFQRAVRSVAARRRAKGRRKKRG